MSAQPCKIENITYHSSQRSSRKYNTLRDVSQLLHLLLQVPQQVQTKVHVLQHVLGYFPSVLQVDV